MDIKEVQIRLTRWKAHYTEFIGPVNALMELTGSSPDCKLFLPIYKLWNAYTDSVEELIGDGFGWLEWYEVECGMGKRAKMVRLGGKEINVKTLRQLAKVIAWDGEE